MRAVVIEQFGELPQVRDVPEPELPVDGVLVQVRATGVCRSDWHAWKGHDADVVLPHIPGHEFSGVIAAVGADVHGWRVGQAVTAPFVVACGVCPECRAGEQQVCRAQEQPGFTYAGSFAELVAVPRADVGLVAVPAEMSPVAAATLGCRAATAFRAVVDRARVRAGEQVVVVGCGGVGLWSVAVAAASGANVVAVDLSADALALASQLGAARSVLVEPGASAGETAEAVVEATGGGAHVSVDALGSAGTLETAVRSLRRRGRHVQVGLLLDGPTAVAMDRVVAWELDVLGSHGMAAHDYPRLLAWLSRSSLDPESLVTEVVPLDAAPTALAALGEPGAKRGVTVVTP
ncbi:MAG: alcohol dehydrogenase catalytic domain-containing protein [Actinomycetales bacterium]